MITVISTGGTISTVLDPATGRRIPALDGQGITARGRDEIRYVDLYSIASQNVTVTHMVQLADAIQGELAAQRGPVVVTHGTDTLEEVAFFVAELTQNADCIFTGAMRRADAVSADGPANIAFALEAAAQLDGVGTCIAMNESLLPAAAAVKAHSTALEAFEPRFGGVIARRRNGAACLESVAPGANWIGSELIADAARPRAVIDVGILDLGCSPDLAIVSAAAHAPAAGFVLKGLGIGQMPASVHEFICELAARTRVVLVTRCQRGPTTEEASDPGAWDDLRAAGVAFEEVLDPYKARIRLFLLAAADQAYVPFRSGSPAC